jgi:hypothetical protein
MASIGDTTRPAFAYDSATDTWIPVGIGPHSHTASGVGAVATSSFAAKGDLLVGTGAGTLATQTVGANGTVLTANSAEADGVEWATPSSGGMTLISTTTMSGASILLSSIPQTYKNLRLVFRNYRPATGGENITMRVNDDSTANRHAYNANYFFAGPFNQTFIRMSHSVSTASTSSGQFEFLDYTSTGTWKMGFGYDANNSNNVAGEISGSIHLGAYNQTGAITSLRIAPTSGNFTSGTILLYGVA